MNTRATATAGFTLIELLVGMGILSFILLAIMQLQSTSTRFSTYVASSGERTERQTAALYYIGDRFRGSVSWTLPSSITLDASKTCSMTATDGLCTAFVTPETTFGQASGAITRYVLLAYRVENRTTFTDRRPDTWADSNSTMIIREYRAVLPCGTTCTAANVSPLPTLTFGSAVVADGFTLTGVGGTIKPFALSGNQLTLTLRSHFKDNGTTRYLPSNANAVNTFTRRN